ncbi:hypothetical protein HD554DRAFT_1300393 [Boletus coccyginus]|nr:hypothetical protein HD554DRAFT_1300393 [Boletus coccyginus]
MPPTTLPPQLPTQLLGLSPDIGNAYSAVLRFEESARTYSDSKTRSTSLVYARILGCLLLHGPSDETRKTVAKEVVSCATKDTLEGTGKLYFDFVLVKGRTLVQSSHPSRYSFDDIRQLKGKTLKQPPQNHSVAKRRGPGP